MSTRSPRRSTVLAFAFITIGAALLAAPSASSAGDLVAAAGTVNSVAADDRKINITHDPIPALGWPGMTMDFKLARDIKLEGVEPGAKISFQLRKRSDGAYVIESLSIAEQ